MTCRPRPVFENIPCIFPVNREVNDRDWFAAVEARRVAGRVRCFMRKRRVITLGVPEALEGRHLHVIVRDAVVRHSAAVTDGGAGCSEELFRMRDALHGLGTCAGFA